MAGMPVSLLRRAPIPPYHYATEKSGPHKTKNNNKKKRKKSDNSQFSTFVDVEVPLPKTEALRNARAARLLVLAFLTGNRTLGFGAPDTGHKTSFKQNPTVPVGALAFAMYPFRGWFKGKPKANQPFLEGHLILTQSHLLDLKYRPIET